MLLPLLLACADPPPPGPPDVLMVVLDTVRADATAVAGGSAVVTPQLAAFAAQGWTWPDTTTAGTWSWPSHASIFTGTPPWVHGAHFAPPKEGTLKVGGGLFQVTPMRPDLPTLGDRFGSAGYRTVCLTANALLDRGVGLDRGFSIVEHGTDAETLARATALAGAPEEGPLFLFVNLMLAHSPWTLRPAPFVQKTQAALDAGRAPSELQPFLVQPWEIRLFTGPSTHEIGVLRYARGELGLSPASLALIRTAYDSEVWAADQAFGEILAAWDRQHPHSVVAVMSDHGEYLGEHQRFDHGRHVHTEVLRVPLVVRAPALSPGVVVDVPAQLHGVAGTVLRLAGLPPHSAEELPQPGDAPRPILAASWPDAFWTEQVGAPYQHGFRYYREGTEALVLRDDGVSERYDLAADPWMGHPDADEAARARLLERAQAAFPAETTSEPLSLPAETLEQLKTLGYVDPER